MSSAIPYDVVIMTMSRWDGDVSSAILSLAKELAKQRRVYYWDHPYSFKELLQNWSDPGVQSRRVGLLRQQLTIKKVAGTPEGFHVVTPPLTLPINWMSPGKRYERCSQLNDHILNRALTQLLKREGISQYIFLNSFDPFFFRQIRQKQMPILRIYQSRDDISQEAYIARHGVYLEKEQLEKAELRLATSFGLQELLNRPSYPVLRLANAADTALFAQGRLPGQLPEDWPIPASDRPVIGYIGSLSPLRMDFSLLWESIDRHPDKDFFFIGSGELEDRNLLNKPNVYVLGPRPLSTLPNYLRGIDVTVIPFLCNTLTRSIYPLKINEYLAAGKPVVSTNFSKDVSEFASVTYLAESAQAFSDCIQQALDENSESLSEIRGQWAEQNSWKVRTAFFEQLVRDKLLQKNYAKPD